MLKQEPGIFYLRFPGQLLMRQRQFKIKTVLLVFTGSKKRALIMEKTHPFTLQNACRWCRKNVTKSLRQLFLRLLKSMH